MRKIFLFLLILPLISFQNSTNENIQVQGEFQKWHKLTLLLNGPNTSEFDRDNPFLNYKLDVTFTNGNKTYSVPGFYATDGDAGETSAEKGNVWKVHFRPDKIGVWNYKISFRKGENIVVKDGSDLGTPLPMDGKTGSFNISDSDKTGSDFRSKGRIINGGKGYFKFQDTDEIWLKSGADSPENFLAFTDFDQTTRFSLKTEVREGEADPKESLHKYEGHIKDWKKEDPTWKNGKGKGIIGALNYLSSVGVNSQYMLTLNILGDGKDVWPFTNHNERYRFDVSKLDQWEIVFEHMDKLGMMIHFVLQETENECLLDGGYTDVQRKLYLRELVARFGHHLAVSWNLGEENGPTDWSPIGQTDQQKKDMANYLKTVNPYPNIVVLHTHSNDEKQDEYLTPMLGYKNLDGPSMQIGDPTKTHDRIKKWVQMSEESGKRWLVNFDELGPHWKGIMPDTYDKKHDTVRDHALWGSLLAGAAGVEWYFGYRYPHTDLTLEDFRSRDLWWKQSAIATSFLKNFPLEEMGVSDAILGGKKGYCLAKENELYIVYLPKNSQNPKLVIDSSAKYSIKWFDPRNGGALQKGTKTSFKGGALVPIGSPPSELEQDWVVVVQKK